MVYLQIPTFTIALNVTVFMWINISYMDPIFGMQQELLSWISPCFWNTVQLCVDDQSTYPYPLTTKRPALLATALIQIALLPAEIYIVSLK